MDFDKLIYIRRLETLFYLCGIEIDNINYNPLGEYVNAKKGNIIHTLPLDFAETIESEDDFLYITDLLKSKIK